RRIIEVDGRSQLTNGSLRECYSLAQRNHDASLQVFEQIRLNVDEQRKNGLTASALVAVNGELRHSETPNVVGVGALLLHVIVVCRYRFTIVFPPFFA